MQLDLQWYTWAMKPPRFIRPLTNDERMQLEADRRTAAKHGQNISYMDAEIIGSYFEVMLQTLRPFRLATLELFTTSLGPIFGSKQDPFISALA